MPARSRNVINIAEIKEMVYSLTSPQLPQYINTWILRNLKNHLIRKHDNVINVTEAQPGAPIWLKKALIRGEPVIQVNLSPAYRRKIEHVIDYFVMNDSFQRRIQNMDEQQAIHRITRISVPEAIRQSEKWTEQLHKKAEADKTSQNDKKTDYALQVNTPSGKTYYWVPLRTENALLEEGHAMKHCLGGYGRALEDGKLFYSLRDDANRSHISVYLDKGGFLNEARCRGNSSIPKKYIGFMESLFKHLEKDRIPDEELERGFRLETLSNHYLSNLIKLEKFLAPECSNREISNTYPGLVHSFNNILDNKKSARRIKMISVTDNHECSLFVLCICQDKLLDLYLNEMNFQAKNLNEFERINQQRLRLKIEDTSLERALLSTIRRKSRRGSRKLASWGASCSAYHFSMKDFNWLAHPDQKALSILFRFTIKIDGRDFQGETALHYAVRNQDTELIHFLVGFGADVNASNQKGESTLTLAVITGNTAIIDRLIEYGVEINSADKLGNSPLMIAAKVSSPQVIEQLLHYGADVHHTNEDGDTALLLAAIAGIKKSLQLLLERGAVLEATNKRRQTALLMAALYRRKQVVKYLVAKGANVNQMDQDGANALVYAIEEGSSEMVNFLLGDLRFSNRFDWQPQNIYLDAINKDGNTPLMLAVKNRDEFLVETLLELGADPGLENSDGETAWSMAINMQDPVIQEILTQYQADDEFEKEEFEEWDYYCAEDFDE